MDGDEMSAGNDRNDQDNSDLSHDDDLTQADNSALDGEEAAADGQPSPQERIRELEEQVAATKDKWLRALADHENYKKRVKRETDEAVLRAVQNLLPAFLPVMDNLERALEAAEPVSRQASEENAKNVQQLVMGLKMVRDEFSSALARNGIETVQSVGNPFDPAIHDALQQIDSPDHAPGVVIREFERGYKMGERLLRPARVIVAGAGSTGNPPAGEGPEA